MRLQQVQGPSLLPALQPLPTLAPAVVQQQHQLLPQHKLQLQLALLHRAQELQQQQQQGAPALALPAAAGEIAVEASSSVAPMHAVQQHEVVKTALNKHKAAKRCLGRAAARRAAAGGSVRWQTRQAAAVEADAEDPAMLAALPVAMPAAVAEQAAAAAAAVVVVLASGARVAAAGKSSAAGRAAGSKKKRSRREQRTKRAAAPTEPAEAGAKAAARASSAVGIGDGRDQGDAAAAAVATPAPACDDLNTNASVAAAAAGTSRASTAAAADSAAAQDAAAVLATLPQPPHVMPSVLLRLAPICLSQGAILSRTADPLLRAVLLEQPALMRAMQALLHKVCVVWRRQLARSHQQQPDATGDVSDTQAEQLLFDLQHPSSDLVCWDTLDRLVRQPSSIVGGGGGPSRQQQRQQQPLYAEEEEAGEGEQAGVHGDGAAVDSDDEEEYLSSLALAREARVAANRAYLHGLGLASSAMQQGLVGALDPNHTAVVAAARKLARQAAVARAEKQLAKRQRLLDARRRARRMHEARLRAALDALTADEAHAQQLVLGAQQTLDDVRSEGFGC
ncbi:hypothetical protein COO60DRAFT_1632663 [Scenedesmus sp. NREL 46B-D3]|nr:hypothetical protein COO60DRAFT_1632663 [Scenedesmus sp. NREL 46B-D3]